MYLTGARQTQQLHLQKVHEEVSVGGAIVIIVKNNWWVTRSTLGIGINQYKQWVV